MCWYLQKEMRNRGHMGRVLSYPLFPLIKRIVFFIKVELAMSLTMS